MDETIVPGTETTEVVETPAEVVENPAETVVTPEEVPAN